LPLKIIEGTRSILKASKEMPYQYSSADDKLMAEAKARFERELDTMLQVKR
jgi:molybdenum-dependent DNA-binding transcriptional regulator ModE